MEITQGRALLEEVSMQKNPKRKLIIAAIHLFSEHGVNSVSLRMINREAGQKNNSALHYHFGNKLGLIEAMGSFIQDHFNAIRAPRLAALEESVADGSVTLHQLLELVVEPYAEIIDAYDWGYSSVRTLARMEFNQDEEVLSLSRNAYTDAAQGIARLVHPLVPELPAREFNKRINFWVSSLVRDFANYRALHMSYFGNLKPKSLSELTRFHVKMGLAILSAPA
ncbi:MAG: TetR/AcrR family transcriptional regulator [Myxococcota bacterium]|nr:TetR/AcrR family transcriptional regulator [Myxococcota bacterium]